MNEKAKAISMGKRKFVDLSAFNLKIRSTFYCRLPLSEITKGKEISSFIKVRFEIKKLWKKNV